MCTRCANKIQTLFNISAIEYTYAMKIVKVFRIMKDLKLYG